jgi:hypothetical protein
MMVRTDVRAQKARLLQAPRTRGEEKEVLRQSGEYTLNVYRSIACDRDFTPKNFGFFRAGPNAIATPPARLSSRAVPPSSIHSAL